MGFFLFPFSFLLMSSKSHTALKAEPSQLTEKVKVQTVYSTERAAVESGPLESGSYPICVRDCHLECHFPSYPYPYLLAASHSSSFLFFPHPLTFSILTSSSKTQSFVRPCRKSAERVATGRRSRLGNHLGHSFAVREYSIHQSSLLRGSPSTRQGSREENCIDVRYNLLPVLSAPLFVVGCLFCWTLRKSLKGKDISPGQSYIQPARFSDARSSTLAHSLNIWHSTP
ncbi:hypothetical protein V8F33_001894 [Rhypophila sp. PSN 637]